MKRRNAMRCLWVLLIASGVCVGASRIALSDTASMPPAGTADSKPKTLVGAADRAGLGPIEEDIFSKKISLDLRDMDIVDVLKFLSLKGNFNIVIDKQISGRVTLVLKDVTIRDAMDIVLKANSLAYVRTNNIVYIMTGTEYLNIYGNAFDDSTDVRIVSLKYAKPSYVLATLDNIKSNVGKIVIDEDTGSLVLIDTPASLNRMEKTLSQIDNMVETSVFKLQYAVAEEITAQLKTKLDAKSVGSIQADARSNQVIVTALPDRMKEVRKLIQDLDQPTKAVLIEIRFLKIVLNPQYDYGIDWSNPFTRSHSPGFKALNIDQSFPISTNVGTIVGAFTYGAINTQLLQVEIKALKQVTDSKIIASPRIMVVNKEEAQIHIGDTVPYVTSTTTGSGDTATVSEEINFIDIGIKLSVTPTINDDGYVSMKVRPEISSRTGDVTTPQGAKIPQVNTTFVETTAMVKDEHTVIIGGLKQLQGDTDTKGLPALMNIPFFGKLFRSESEDVVDTEIVIFLTPHIITGAKNITDANNKIRDDHNYEGLTIKRRMHNQP